MEKISCSHSSDITLGVSNFIWAYFLSPIKIHLKLPITTTSAANGSPQQ